MFNALKYSKDLEAAGFSRQQAEAAIDVFFKFMEHNFATKDDFAGIKSEIDDVRIEAAQFRQEVRAEFAEVRHEMKAIEYRMTIKVGAMQAAGIAILAAVIKLF